MMRSGKVGAAKVGGDEPSFPNPPLNIWLHSNIDGGWSRESVLRTTETGSFHRIFTCLS